MAVMVVMKGRRKSGAKVSRLDLKHQVHPQQIGWVFPARKVHKVGACQAAGKELFTGRNRPVPTTAHCKVLALAPRLVGASDAICNLFYTYY